MKVGSRRRAIAILVLLACWTLEPIASHAETQLPRRGCTIRGTRGPDNIRGTGRPDVICGFGGAT